MSSEAVNKRTFGDHFRLAARDTGQLVGELGLGGLPQPQQVFGGERVRGGLLILVGILMAVFMAGGGMLIMSAGHRHDDQVGGAVMMAGGIVGGIIMIAIGLFDLYTGTKIRRQAPIGRTLGIIVCILSLFSFPLGTALGVYGLWFLFSDMGKALYLGQGLAPAQFDRPQPPPNSWA